MSMAEGFALSPQQGDLWRLYEAGGEPYRCRCLVRVAGRVDAAALAEALVCVTNRFEVLRTRFLLWPELKIPLQVVEEAAAPSLGELDLRALDRTGRERAVLTLWETSARWPFDLERGPVLAAVLASESEGEHRLLLVLPALCMDAAGMSVLVEELFSEYAGVERPDDPLQYVDLAQWQNGIFDAEDGREGVELWSRLDLAVLSELALPCARTPHVGGAFAPRRLAIPLAPASWQRLAALAAERGVAAPDLLLAGWVALLWRLGRRPDLIIGISQDGRNYAELEQALGLFERFLPLAVAADDRLRFADLLAEVARAAEQARQWQQCFCWERLPAGGRGERPFFPFCFERRPSAPRRAGLLSFAVERSEVCTDRFELKLVSAGRDDELELELHYDADRYLPADVATVAERFSSLLASALAMPGGELGELDLLGEAERARLLARFDGGGVELPDQGFAHQLFARWVERTPDAPAAYCDGRQLTYRELAAESGRLARRLRRMGVGPEVAVGLCVERSLDAMVGLLAVLEAGGAFVPLDPALPRERLATILDDCRPAVLLIQGRLRSVLPASLPPVIDLETAGAALAQEPPAGEAAEVLPEHLAYVIYTSGSTGRPKGVAVAHRSLRNYVEGLLLRSAAPAGWRWAALSTLGADLGQTAIFGALCGGGCLHLVAAERAFDPAAMAEELGRRPIDALKIVPSHLAALLAADVPERLLPRRLLVLGGEPCGWDLVERVRTLAGCRILNHYGPTETTVGVMTFEAADRPMEEPSWLPLDHPLANSRIYLLDANLQPVARWVHGELCIAGEGLARGYLNRPDQTAEKFVPDPHGAAPGGRLYRTGDLARHLSGGGLEIAGRADHQVKVRGFRIELGEIEVVLREHPGVAAAVVQAFGETSGERRLAAYFVPTSGASPSAGELRQHLADRLPDYMVPPYIVPLQSLPLNASGKLDRRALPAPESAAAAGDVAPPRTAAEEVVAGIWAEVLKVDGIGYRDSFFERGGHSLLVTQVVSRVRECFQVELSLRDFFAEPTVEGVAAQIAAARRTGGPAALPVVAVPRQGPLPLSFSQQRLWFFDQLQPGSSFYNIFNPMLLVGPLDLPALARTLTEIVRRHEVLRTVFASAEGQPVQVVERPRPHPLPLIDLSGLGEPRAEQEALRLAGGESLRPFDLARGPLLRSSLLRLGLERHVALFTMHHIASDAWSMGILVREVGALYQAFSTGRPSPLVPLAVQYADFAVWQRRWLDGEHLERELSYWRRQLAGMPPVLEIPADHRRPPVQGLRGASEPVVLSAALATGLRLLARREGVTLFMALLAVFQVLLRHRARRDDIVVGTNVANRDRLETEELIGFFINQLVLRTDLSGNPTFRDLLARVRAVTLGAYDHQHVPFERLVEELQPPRDRSRSLLYQFKIDYTDAARERPELHSLVMVPFPLPWGVARYDLHLALSSAGEEIRGSMHYDIALFEAATVRRLAQELRVLLEAVVADPDLQLDDLGERLARGERERRSEEDEAYAGALLRRFDSVRRSGEAARGVPS